MTADLVRKYGCVDYAEALDTEHAEMRVDDASLGRSANTCGGRLQKLAVSSYGNRSGGKGAVGREEGDKTAGTHRVECGAAVAADEFFDLLVRNLK